MYRLVAVALGVALVGGACSASTATPEPRTFYESLDLSSPEATVETFVEAFTSDDFMTVWMTFDFSAQNEIRNTFNLLQYSALVDSDKIPNAGTTITDPISDLIGRGNIDMWHIFDELMLVADKHDAFLIDIGRLETASLVGDIESGRASVVVVLAGSDDELIFKLTQGDSDRWFVHQVVTPGGYTTQIPWSVAH